MCSVIRGAFRIPLKHRVPVGAFGQCFGFHTRSRVLKQRGSEDGGGLDKKNNKDGRKGFRDLSKSRLFTQSLYYAIGASLLIKFFVGDGDEARDKNDMSITLQEFRTRYLEKGLVKHIYVYQNNSVKGVLFSDTEMTGRGQSRFGLGFDRVVWFTVGSVELFEEQLERSQDKLQIPENERIPVTYVGQSTVLTYVFALVSPLIVLGGLHLMTRIDRTGAMRGPGGLFGVWKSRARLFNHETDVKVKFKDIAGCDEAKLEIIEFVNFLKDPEKYKALGARIPKGAILSGPPGTGKTLLAKATAGEASVPFLSVSGSEFVEMFVGVGASRVRDLFQTARRMAPAIIFVDEIDAIGRMRGKGGVMGGSNDEREATLNQLLVEMDGFTSGDQVVVLAGTNRPDVLDSALMRPGRFDRHIQLDAPDVEGRKAIYKVHLAKLNLESKLKTIDDQLDHFSGKLATLTPGFTGADIANACNEAALIAVREESEHVEFEHFEKAIERLIAGLEKKTRVLSPEEKTAVAYHEAGHAVCGWLLQYADPLLKVSIIPRGQGALGYAQYLPSDQYLVTEKQFRHRMIMALGGRVSEELHFPNITSGAHDDFKKVTAMASSMVTTLGMSPEIGYVSYDQSDVALRVSKPFSEKTARKIDMEVKRILDESHSACKKLLKDNIEKVDKVAKLLLSKEVITRQDMINLLGPRPFPERNDAFEKYLDPKSSYTDEQTVV